MRQLPEIEYRVLEGLAERGEALVEELAVAVQLDQSQVHAAGVALADEGLVGMTERPYRDLSVEADAPAELPERSVIRALDALGGAAELTEIPEHSQLDQRAVGQSLRWLKSKGWTSQEGRRLELTDAGRQALAEHGPDEQLLGAIVEAGGSVRDDQLAGKGVPVDEAVQALAPRKGLIRVKERTERRMVLTALGREAWQHGVGCRRQVSQLTSEMLASGEWRDVDFRPYDVTAATARIAPGKAHPFRRVLAETRRVFLEMGFEEVASPLVESSFWDFDALFQPQDHPAREMQDTFYIARPERTGLPEERYVEAVGATHTDGGSTGSVGWRIPWRRELAARPVLRTHCTAATVRALAANPAPPHKVFCVGPVFRRETVDYKHLPVFHQVDGVVIDEHASFAQLLGFLDAFYRKMGFDTFEFRPAFFPYTEPSVEVFVWLEERGDWVEMGGAGVFRPEVTEPAGCEHPVLAWGLGLERVAMFRYGLTDIRDLYLADLQWLKEAPLCR
jgi:phenylalanyl-tRNA synthetase alpha chain